MDKKHIGIVIKAKREQRGLSLNALSLKALTHTGKVMQIHQIKSIEEGAKNYTIDSLLTLCELLDLEVTIK